MQEISGGITVVQGILAGGLVCGIKASGRKDLGAVLSERPCTLAGVFTTNKVKAAPVLLCQERLRGGQARAIVYNSGNANAATGAPGLENARQVTRWFAERFGLGEAEVLTASTGVIGVQLPMERIHEGIGRLALTRDGGAEAAEAMMTTDTRPKTAAAEIELGGARIRIAGMCKGAAMIHPNMATMLCFVATDAAADASFLQGSLRSAVADSFNMITVDGDQSTNDTVLLLANGAAWPAGRPPLSGAVPEAYRFTDALRQVCARLARAIVADAEGATKVFTVRVAGAATAQEARVVARTVAGSNLTKAAVHGNDPNWGRIACAAGYSGAQLDPNLLEVWIGPHHLVEQGTPLAFDAAAASAYLNQPQVELRVHLHLGPGEATAWGCDLSEEYVTLNSEYTT
jgi:glutamate N-acetyltransferase/amino-acid N-acetyltransferase